MIDLRDFLREVARIVERHALGGPGLYARRLAETTANPYGCADAANLLYTLDLFPAWPEHAAWIDSLQSFQDGATGLFREESHDPIHTTAHVAGALELFGATPRHPLSALERWADPAALEAFLDALDWSWNPWGESHKGAGLYAARVLARAANDPWVDCYFAWLQREADPGTGFWRRGHVATGGDAMLFHHLAGSFHYLFNHAHARRPLPYPAAMVETCLRLRQEALFPPLGRTIGYAELDWVYCVNRAARQSGHAQREAHEAMTQFAQEYAAFLLGLDPLSDPGLNDLHQLLGAVSALAELQQAVPGLLRSPAPLRLVLDRRPFI